MKVYCTLRLHFFGQTLVFFVSLKFVKPSLMNNEPSLQDVEIYFLEKKNEEKQTNKELVE